MKVSVSNNSEPSLSYSEILDLVKSEFILVDAYMREDIPTFVIAPNQRVSEKIEQLRLAFSPFNLAPILNQKDQELIIEIVNIEKSIPARSSILQLRFGVPLILFVATTITVSISGYLLASNHIDLLRALGRLNLSQSQINAYRLELTVLYTISVMGTLSFHELGHLITAMIHRIKASVPYFIPGIPGFTIGTFGAVIRQESRPLDRNQLFDLGISGPLFGFIAAVIVSFFGYSWSIPVTRSEYLAIVQTMGPFESIFPPAIFMLLESHVLPDPSAFTHFLHPVAYAGWICTLITFLNTFPIGQLDGGHVARALLGEKWHRRLYIVMAGIMILSGWVGMALLSLFLIRAFHPGPIDDLTKITNSRKLGVVLFILISAACFTLSSGSILIPLFYP